MINISKFLHESIDKYITSIRTNTYGVEWMYDLCNIRTLCRWHDTNRQERWNFNKKGWGVTVGQAFPKGY